MNVKEIVEKYIRENNYEGLSGLAGLGCGCSIDDLMPCDCPDITYCCPAYRVTCEKCGQVLYMPTKEQPEKCDNC